MPKLLRLCLVSPVLLIVWSILPGQAAHEKEPRLRRPVALLLTAGDAQLLIANRDSGSVAVLDTRQQEIVGETRFGGRLSDMTELSGRLLLTDEEAGEVVV